MAGEEIMEDAEAGEVAAQTPSPPKTMKRGRRGRPPAAQPAEDATEKAGDVGADANAGQLWQLLI